MTKVKADQKHHTTHGKRSGCLVNREVKLQLGVTSLYVQLQTKDWGPGSTRDCCKSKKWIRFVWSRKFLFLRYHMNSETVSLQIVRQHQVCQETSLLGEKEEELENGFFGGGCIWCKKTSMSSAFSRSHIMAQFNVWLNNQNLSDIRSWGGGFYHYNPLPGLQIKSL